MLEGQVPVDLIFGRGDVSRCEQTQDAVAFKLVADGIGFARAVTSASPCSFRPRAQPLAEDLTGSLTLSLTNLHQGSLLAIGSSAPWFTYSLHCCREKCSQTAGAQPETASTESIER